MTRHCPVLLCIALACSSDSGADGGTDADTTSSESTSESTSDPGGSDSTSSGATTMGSGSATGGSSAGDTGSSEGGGDCPEGGPAEFTEVDGCTNPVGEGFCSEGQGHVPDGSDPQWSGDPPHSGEHYPMWEIWGEHSSTVPRGNWVHNLEHGGVALLHLCPGGCDAELDVLRQVVADRPDSRILMTPDPDLPGQRFAAVSWTWVYRFDQPDLDTLLCFVDQHFNHAPEDVP